jgi:serine/threonine protein kinase
MAVAMSDVTPEKLGQRIADSGLLEARQLETVWSELGSREVTIEQLTGLLLRRELLTNYQLDRLLKGERGGYFYNDYRVLYLIGTGTFARVYRSVHRVSGKVVAVKVLRKRFREDTAATDQFLREGQLGVNLKHLNIVPIYEVSSQPSPYLVMEFVEGRNLREFAKIRKKIDPVESLKLAIDILAGLAYAAEKGMAHRDLKMSNVLVTSRGRAKLVDFGLASLQTKDDDFTNPRTIDYAGLERASGVRNNDPRSDLFFAGCILYNMVAGVPPLAETRDRISRLSVQRYQNIKPVLELAPEVPRRLATFIGRALELNADRRFSTPQEMLDEAKRVLVRLEAGDTGDNEPVPDPASGGPSLVKELPTELEGLSKTIMIVESKIEMQDLLREKLKKYGYRVLVFSDPDRALNRFQDGDAKPADCVMFCTTEMGEYALEAFNKFGTDHSTRHIPAVLFVEQRHPQLLKMASLAPHRVILMSPIKVRELRELLLKLLNPGYIAGKKVEPSAAE